MTVRSFDHFINSKVSKVNLLLTTLSLLLILSTNTDTFVDFSMVSHSHFVVFSVVTYFTRTELTYK